MNTIEKLEARLKIAKERDEMARKYLGQGAVILTKVEAEEILALLKGMKNG